MTNLDKPIKRKTGSLLWQNGPRHVIVSIEPTREGAVIGFRLERSREVYRLGVGGLYAIAVQQHQQKIERKAKQIHKTEGVPMRSAKARARKELAKELVAK